MKQLISSQPFPWTTQERLCMPWSNSTLVLIQQLACSHTFTVRGWPKWIISSRKNSWWTLPHFVLTKCHEQLVFFFNVWIIKTKWPTWLKVGICTNVWLHQSTYEYGLLNKPGSAPMDRNQTTHISKPWPVRPCMANQEEEENLHTNPESWWKPGEILVCGAWSPHLMG